MERDNYGSQDSPNSTSWDDLKNVEFNAQPLSETVDTSHVSNLNLSESGDLGPGRHDYAVNVTDSTGNSMRSSNIMLGKDNTFEFDGRLLSLEELQTAIEKSLADGGDDAKLERIEPAKSYDDRTEAIRDILISASESADSITLSPSEKNPHQDARETTLHSAETGEERKSSLLFFGNERVEMPNGQYVSATATAAALANFMLKTPIIPPVTAEVPSAEIPTADSSPEQLANPEIHDGVVERTKNPSNRKRLKFLIPLILAASVALIPSSQRSTNDISTPDASRPVIEYATPDIPQPIIENAFPDIPQQTIESAIPTPESIEQSFASGINIGDIYNISLDESGEPIIVYESSDHEYGGKDAEGKIGGDILQEGNYEVESFSILNPETHATDNVTWEEGTNLEDYMQEVSKRTGADVEDLETKIHLSKDGSPAGWIELEDLENNINNNQGQ